MDELMGEPMPETCARFQAMIDTLCNRVTPPRIEIIELLAIGMHAVAEAAMLRRELYTIQGERLDALIAEADQLLTPPSVPRR